MDPAAISDARLPDVLGARAVATDSARGMHRRAKGNSNLNYFLVRAELAGAIDAVGTSALFY